MKKKRKNYYKFLKRNKPPGVLPYKRLMGPMCRWMWSHFHDWVGYNGVAFSINGVTRMGSHKRE